MSGGAVCRCGKREAWRVWTRKGNFSAFNGYQFTPSAWSELTCEEELGGCGARWRTRAAYVDQVPGVGAGASAHRLARAR